MIILLSKYFTKVKLFSLITQAGGLFHLDKELDALVIPPAAGAAE